MASAATPPDTPEPDAEEQPAAPKGLSVMSLVIAMVILTGVGVGAGGLLGLQLIAKLEKPAASKAEAPSVQGPKSRYAGSNVNVKPLPPIVTNLASPERTWVRLEGSIVVDGDQTAESNVLAAQISEDVVAFLRTVSLAQIQGPSGFQHLREDLNERVRVRSGGKVRDMVIQTFIVE
jgi:flagellar FliL protein